MKPRTIGARALNSWIRRPVDLRRLLGQTHMQLPPASPLDLPFRVLVKVDAKTSQSEITEALTAVWEETGERRETSKVASRVRVRPLGRQLKDGSRWFVVELPVPLGSYLHEVEYDPARMNEVTSEIQQLEGVMAVELDLPSENLVRPLQEFLPGCTAGRAAAPPQVDWAPRLVGLFDLPADAPTGAGVRIGQLDTGFTDHPELDVDEAYDRAASTSTIDSGGGVDPMVGGTSHGTATGSVITSRRGTQSVDDLGNDSPGITGLAPGATLVAVRTLDSVAVAELPILVPSSIAEALHHAIGSDAHVITMSFGGIVSQSVRDALREAYENDIILCAAAGNCVGFVIEPASFPEVIGCGGLGIDPETRQVHLWPGTSQGPEVDISAPAENVWIADWINQQALVRPGEGTSFASPHVAGAAALWLDQHGRNLLLNRYKNSDARLCDVFRQVVRDSATVPPSWNTFMNGAGVLNIPNLLNERLPHPDEVFIPPPTTGFLDLIPRIEEPVDVVVDINQIIVKDDGELVGGAEPYLLMSFLTIDGTTARIEATLDMANLNLTHPPLQVQLFRADGSDSIIGVVNRGEHGNIQDVNIGPWELAHDGPVKVSVANVVGRFRATLKPIPIKLFLENGDASLVLEIEGMPGWVGVHVILGEQDNTTDDAAVVGRDAIADGLREILEGVFQDLDLSDVSIDPENFSERMADVEDDARIAATASMTSNLWDAFWGGLDPDDHLIQQSAIANVLQLQREKVAIDGHYVGSDGNWCLKGEIRIDP